MALNTAYWQIRTDKSIRYIGGDHGTATANYVTVLELHRFLMDLADNASVVDDDYMDITTVSPSDKKFDTIITLTNDYTLDDAYTTPASEFIYGGSIIQGTGGTEKIYDGIKIVANRGVTVNVIQDDAVLSNKFWNSVPDGEKTASGTTVTGVNTTAQKVLNVADSSYFEAGDYIMIGTVVDEVYQVDELIDGTSIRLTEDLGTATAGGETIYDAIKGINPDPANGVAMQFMVEVRTSGADLDNKTLLFTTREWYKTYSEFRIPATGRGVNTVPLQYASDLNNTTPMDDIYSGAAFVAPFNGVSNVTAGFNLIDVNQDSTDEEYYSEWDKGSCSINQFYEYMKYITRNGETTTTYGIAGEQFRGISHSIEFTGAATPSAFADGDTLYWDTDGSTAVILAMDTTNDIAYVQLLTGVVPGDSETLYSAASQSGNSAATLASDGTTEKTVSAPACGASTGSSLVGAYGFALEYADLAVNDKIQALDGTTRQPPNNVQFYVYGIESSYRVLVGPEDGSGGLDYDQLSLQSALTSAGTTSVQVDASVPANTPTSGTIRIHRADGSYTRHAYSGLTTTTNPNDTFTITSADFDSNNSNASGNVFISYIDDASSGTSMSYNTVQTTTQTLYVEARYGGTGPNYTDSIKPAKTTGTLGSTGGSATLSPVSDA